MIRKFLFYVRHLRWQFAEPGPSKYVTSDGFWKLPQDMRRAIYDLDHAEWLLKEPRP